MAELKFYSPLEERINIVSHAIGLALSLLAMVLLVERAMKHGDIVHILSFGVFGLSLVIMFAASVAYHGAKAAKRRSRLRVIDHAAIYVLIAGTYTPFTLITLSGTIGWTMFGVTWAMAIVGITLKIFFTGRYNLLSTSMYVFMGWVIVFVIKPLTSNLAAEGLFWLVAGGIAYTVGAIIYVAGRMNMNHAMFHVFVLAGSACHVIAVLFYVLPV